MLEKNNPELEAMWLAGVRHIREAERDQKENEDVITERVETLRPSIEARLRNARLAVARIETLLPEGAPKGWPDGQA